MFSGFPGSWGNLTIDSIDQHVHFLGGVQVKAFVMDHQTHLTIQGFNNSTPFTQLFQAQQCHLTLKVAILPLCWKTWTSWWLVHSWQEMTSVLQIFRLLLCCNVCLKIPWCHRHAGTSTLGGKISMHDQRFKRRWFDPIGGGGKVQDVLHILHAWSVESWEILKYLFVRFFRWTKQREGLGLVNMIVAPIFTRMTPLKRAQVRHACCKRVLQSLLWCILH